MRLTQRFMSCCIAIVGLCALPRDEARAQATSTALQQRIADLEMKVRQLDKLVATMSEYLGKLQIRDDSIASASAGGAGAAARRPSAIVRAPFVVQDSKGRAIFTVDDQDGVATRVNVRTYSRLGYFHFAGPKGAASGGIEMLLDVRQRGRLSIYNQDGKPGAVLGFDPQGDRVSLDMYADDAHIVRLGSSADSVAGGALELGNEQGDFDAYLGAAKAGMQLRIANDDNHKVAILGVSQEAEGGGALKLYNKDGKSLVGFLAKPKNGAISVYDMGGKNVANLAADAEGRGFVSIGNAKNPDAGVLKLSERTGNGLLEVRNPEGVFAQVGVNQTTTSFGDVCVNSSKQKGVCLSAIAAKNFFFYW